MTNTTRKTLTTIVVLALAAVYLLDEAGDERAQPTPEVPHRNVNDEIAAAFAARSSDVQVRGAGHVVRVLADDRDGSRHQRFILGLDGGATLLIAHNIDLAPRIPELAEGDLVEFFGEYEYNDRGGVVHWTHHDPAGRHPDGWLKHQGKLYQ